MTYRGPFCTEMTLVPGDPHVEDCVAASGIDIGRGAGLVMPVDAAEREALRVDSGDTTGGMDLPHLSAGMTKRYGHTPDASHTWQYVLDHPDRWFVCIGAYQSLPAHYRRWQPTGTFDHAVAFGPYTSASRWFANPLAPANYGGETISLADLKTYMASGGNSALSFVEGSLMIGFTLLSGPSGSLTVKGPGHSYMDLASGNLRPILAGHAEPIAHPIHLNAPIAPGAGDRQTAYLFGGQASAILAQDVTFTPTPVVDCTAQVAAAITADRAKAKVAVVYE